MEPLLPGDATLIQDADDMPDPPNDEVPEEDAPDHDPDHHQ
jgi:hypothetical protein